MKYFFGALIALALAYEIFFRRTTSKWRSATELRDRIAESGFSGPRGGIVIRFENFPYRFVISKPIEDKLGNWVLGVPRTGFNEDDYAKIRNELATAEVTYLDGSSMDRFELLIPVTNNPPSEKAEDEALRVLQTLMKALSIPLQTRFRRYYD
ncbi:MAG: hypothetical protein AAGL69_14990 [Pseudomonadota bacterium]